MAAPITVGVKEQVVGVLDVQENKIAALNQDDLDLLRALAGYIGMALEKLRYLEQTQAALAEIEAIHQRYQARAWETFRSSQPVLRAEQQKPGVPISRSEVLDPIKQQAVQQEKNGNNGNI